MAKGITYIKRALESVVVMAVVAVMMSSCNGTKFVDDGSFLLKKNTITSKDKAVSTTGMSSYLRQRSNAKWFSLFKVPLGIYSMAGRDSTKAINRRLKKWGEAPVVLDTSLVTASCSNLNTIVHNEGYLNSAVEAEITTKGKRASVKYVIDPGQQYQLKSVHYEIADHSLDTLLSHHLVLQRGGLLKTGGPFSVNQLYNERNRITAWLNEHGYYYFNKEHITFVADTSQSLRTVDVTMKIGLYRRSSRDSLQEHTRYRIRHVTFESLDRDRKLLRMATLQNNCLLDSGDYYNSHNVQLTYNKFARLKALRSTNIHLTEVRSEDSLVQDRAISGTCNQGELDALIQLSRCKPHSIQVQPEGTNTAGDFGAALSVTYENRNIFRGSEQLSITARGAYENVRGLEGYDNSNYMELGFEAKLSIPKFLMLGTMHNFDRYHEATTEIPVSYNIQSRPEFRRKVLRATWKFRWNSANNKLGYTFDLLDLNFITMPWISDTFRKDYLDNQNSRNAILRYNYEDMLIMKIGFGVNYTDDDDNLRTSVETAGNLLYGLSNIFHMQHNDLGQYQVAKVAFAQYVKLDADYTHLFKIDYRNTLALHARVGVAVPYCNSTMLPFEKRYFAGGANGVRGWSVRTLGPGGFIGKDGRIDFINQTGDLKIDLNAELRSKLFWKFQGAVFVDAGNIWTLRQYSDQPGGCFTWDSFYNEMAVAYGVGLRLNFDYFILRLDLGMKAINPAYTTSEEHFPIAHPVFSRDYALHFAVGLPF